MKKAYCPKCKKVLNKKMDFCCYCNEDLRDLFTNKQKLSSMGLHAFTSNDNESAAYWFMEAAKLQHGDAQFKLGFLYEKGLGVKKNLNNAAYCYKRAFENGCPEAQDYYNNFIRKYPDTESFAIEQSAKKFVPVFDLENLNSEHDMSYSDGKITEKAFRIKALPQTEQEIFEEEYEHLHETLADIDTYIAEKDALIIPPDHSNIVDETSRENYLYDREIYIIKQRKLDDLKRKLDEPYFARMCLYSPVHKDIQDIYVGKEPVTINGKQIVYSWMSDVGRKAYETVPKFDCKYDKYVLQLKRRMNISKRKLIKCLEEYNINGVSASKGIYDSFLKSVLVQKGKTKHLTDIIKTIQSNQNELIRKPLNENIIVQGCAGSGKTMILLHRLAVLKYTNPNWNLDKVKIITPSENFNFHVDYLWKDLKISDIPLLCLEKYYINILNKYECKQYNNTSICDDALAPDQAAINHIYSDEIIDAVSDILKKTNYKEKLKEKANKAYFESAEYKNYLKKEQQFNESEMNKPYNRRGMSQGSIPPKKHIIPANIFDAEFADIAAYLPVNGKMTYKCELYLQLLLNYMCYGGILKGDSHLFIDEGQNITANEYVLMKNINKNVIFNIFGDTKQLLNKKRGISNWKTQLNILGDINIYRLNENYRNTAEINDYCNKKFGFKNTSLGLEGNDVSHIKLSELISQLRRLNPSEERIAVISTYKNSEVLQKLLCDIPCVCNSEIKQGYISLININEAKSLEFDTVFVMDKNMTKNEKYLAYTRALSNLVIISDDEQQ